MQPKLLYILIISYTFNNLWTWQRSSRWAANSLCGRSVCGYGRALGRRDVQAPRLQELFTLVSYQLKVWGKMMKNVGSPLPPPQKMLEWGQFFEGPRFPLPKKSSHGSSMVESGRILMPPSTHLRGNHVVTGRSQGLLDGDGFLAHQAL